MQLFVYNFFSFFSKIRCTLQIVFCVPAMKFTHGFTYRALTFFSRNFFFIYFGTIFCLFCFGGHHRLKILRILILDRKCGGQIDFFSFSMIFSYKSNIFFCKGDAHLFFSLHNLQKFFGGYFFFEEIVVLTSMSKYFF